MNKGDMPKLDILPAQWEIVKAVLQQHIPGYEVWAFGSRVKHTAKPYSDLDLAVITESPLALETMAALREAFSESDLPWKVDILDWATASEVFNKIILQEKILVQEAGKNVQVNGRQHV